MKCGFLNMTLKYKCDLHRGLEKFHQDWKKQQVTSSVKVMLTVFFDIVGVVHHKFLPDERTVNCWYYLEVKKHLRENVRWKSQLWKNNTSFLHHDNALAHALLLIHEFLAKLNQSMLPQPPYSPGLALADFFLFPKFKGTLKGHMISDNSRYREIFDDGPTRDPEKHLPRLFPKAATALGAMYWER